MDLFVSDPLALLLENGDGSPSPAPAADFDLPITCSSNSLPVTSSIYSDASLQDSASSLQNCFPTSAYGVTLSNAESISSSLPHHDSNVSELSTMPSFLASETSQVSVASTSDCNNSSFTQHTMTNNYWSSSGVPSSLSSNNGTLLSTDVNSSSSTHFPLSDNSSASFLHSYSDFTSISNAQNLNGISPHSQHGSATLNSTFNNIIHKNPPPIILKQNSSNFKTISPTYDEPSKKVYSNGTSRPDSYNSTVTSNNSVRNHPSGIDAVTSTHNLTNENSSLLITSMSANPSPTLDFDGRNCKNCSHLKKVWFY